MESQTKRQVSNVCGLVAHNRGEIDCQSYAVTDAQSNDTIGHPEQKVVKQNRQGTKGWQKPAGMPKRPMSSYNLFFLLERERLVHASNDNTSELESNTSVVYTALDVQAMALHQRVKKREDDAAPLVRRKHRKSHGRISFADLARAIANRWKGLDPAIKAIFIEQGIVEKKAYDKAVAAWRGSLDMESKVERHTDIGPVIARNHRHTPTGTPRDNRHVATFVPYVTPPSRVKVRPSSFSLPLAQEPEDNLSCKNLSGVQLDDNELSLLSPDCDDDCSLIGKTVRFEVPIQLKHEKNGLNNVIHPNHVQKFNAHSLVMDQFDGDASLNGALGDVPEYGHSTELNDDPPLSNTRAFYNPPFYRAMQHADDHPSGRMAKNTSVPTIAYDPRESTESTYQRVEAQRSMMYQQNVRDHSFPSTLEHGPLHWQNRRQPLRSEQQGFHFPVIQRQPCQPCVMTPISESYDDDMIVHWSNQNSHMGSSLPSRQQWQSGVSSSIYGGRQYGLPDGIIGPNNDPNCQSSRLSQSRDNNHALFGYPDQSLSEMSSSPSHFNSTSFPMKRLNGL